MAIWTKEQVESANGFQQAGFMHPFTCGTESCRADLVATEDGWVCPKGCGYTQNWAHDFMLDGSWKKLNPFAGRKQEVAEKKINLRYSGGPKDGVVVEDNRCPGFGKPELPVSEHEWLPEGESEDVPRAAYVRGPMIESTDTSETWEMTFDGLITREEWNKRYLKPADGKAGE